MGLRKRVNDLESLYGKLSREVTTYTTVPINHVVELILKNLGLDLVQNPGTIRLEQTKKEVKKGKSPALTTNGIGGKMGGIYRAT